MPKEPLLDQGCLYIISTYPDSIHAWQNILSLVIGPLPPRLSHLAGVNIPLAWKLAMQSKKRPVFLLKSPRFIVQIPVFTCEASHVLLESIIKRAQIPGVLWPSWQGSVWCCPAVAAAATSWVPSVEGICCGIWQGRFIVFVFVFFVFLNLRFVFFIEVS